MRTILLFLTLLFFEKNAVAVVRPATDNFVQLIENQPVRLLERLSKTTGPKFFRTKTKPAFFKKSKFWRRDPRHSFEDNLAVAALVMGILACALYFPLLFILTCEAGAFAGFLWLLMVVLPLLCFASSIGAFGLKTRRKWAAGFGIFLGLLSWVGAALLILFLGDC